MDKNHAGGGRESVMAATRAVVALLILPVVGACFATVYSAEKFEAVLPVIEQMQAGVYMHDPPDCEYFFYSRGAFSSKPDPDAFCRVFDFEDESGRTRHGGDEALAPTAFDDEARRDLQRLKVEFARVGLPIEYMNVVFEGTGRVAGDSYFAARTSCITYVYEPGYVLLESDEDYTAVAVNENWYRADDCPWYFVVK